MRSCQTDSICITTACLFIALSVILVKTAYPDEVTMKDGNGLMGTVVSMESNRLVFKTTFAGDITII